jgi:hypothetical protein
MNQTSTQIDTQKDYGTALTEADYEQALVFLQLAEEDLRLRQTGSAHCTLLAAMDRLQLKPIHPTLEQRLNQHLNKNQNPKKG